MDGKKKKHPPASSAQFGVQLVHDVCAVAPIVFYPYN